MSKELLESLYLGEKLDVGLIAMRLGVTPSAVSDQLRSFGIPRRPACKRRPQVSEVELTRDLLEDLYLRRHLTLREMATLLGSPVSTVYYELRRLGIVAAREPRHGRAFADPHRDQPQIGVSPSRR